MTRNPDVLVVGGGQAGSPPATTCAGSAWTLSSSTPSPRRAALGSTPGILCACSPPAGYSSLPGRLMPSQPGKPCPDAGHVTAYLADHEKRYQLPVQHGTRVQAVHRDGPHMRAETDTVTWRARAVLSATGTWSRPFVPAVPGRQEFTGRQLHTVGYRRPADFVGQRVIVVAAATLAPDRRRPRL